MNSEEKKALIMRNTAEVVGEEKIEELLEKDEVVCYCGYEPSGEIHMGHIVTVTKLMDLEKAGCKVKILLADWHAWLNQKGDWDFVNEQVATWKKGFSALGLKNAEVVLGSDFQREISYIDDLLKISQSTTLNRALRSMQQVARDIDHAHVSQVMYPLMQILDMKHLKVDIAQSGIEQRKIHMLGLEVLESLGYKKPIFVHTPLIPSLAGPDSGKMSSSDKSSLISVRDTREDIIKKLKKGHCPAGVVEENPVLLIAQLVVFPRLEGAFVIDRPEKFGGKLEFHSYDALEKAFLDGLHPLDVKTAIANYLADIFEPVRKAFGLD